MGPGLSYLTFSHTWSQMAHVYTHPLLATVPTCCTPQDYNVKVDLFMQWTKFKRVTCIMARQQNIQKNNKVILYPLKNVLCTKNYVPFNLRKELQNNSLSWFDKVPTNHFIKDIVHVIAINMATKFKQLFILPSATMEAGYTLL